MRRARDPLTTKNSLGKTDMDMKSRALIADLLLRIDSGTFTEGDVSAFWLALREHVPKYPLVREFGDFVAHRERDKGRIYNHVSTLIEQFKGYPNTTVEVKEAFQETDLIREVSSALQKLSLSVPRNSALRMRIVATFFMIQYALVKNPTKVEKSNTRTPGQLLGELQPFIAADRFGLWLEHVDAKTGATFLFPILWTVRDPSGPEKQSWRPAQPVKVEIRNFELVILSLYQPIRS